ncbi:MAG: hypothetical protein ACM3RP_10190 [Chitinophagales bacterium]
MGGKGLRGEHSPRPPGRSLATPAPRPPAVDEIAQLRARVKELEGQLAADEIIISDLRGRVYAVKQLVAQWR